MIQRNDAAATNAIPKFTEIQFRPIFPMLLLPEQLVDVVVEVPDPELAQPGVLDGRHALGDVPNHLTVEGEVNSPSLGGILSADLLTEDLGLPDVVTLAGQVGPPLPHLRPVPLLLLLGLPPPGQADRHIIVITSSWR